MNLSGNGIFVVGIAIIGVLYVLTMRSTSAIQKVTSNQRSGEVAYVPISVNGAD
jgi:hypothetical protein